MITILARSAWNRGPSQGVKAAMNRTVPGLLVVLLVLSACAASGGTPGSSPGGSGSPPPTGGDGIEHPTGTDPILVVSTAGGMLPVNMQVTTMPSFVLLGDGRVIVQGAQALIFPGPALPALMVRTLNEDGIQAVLEAARDTNLFDSDLDLRAAQNVNTDGVDTVFQLHAGGRDVTVSVYMLGALSDPAIGNPPGVTPADIEADRVLSQFMNGLTTLDSSVEASAWADPAWQTFEPDAFRLFVRDVTGEQIDGGDLPGQVRDWPTDDDPATIGEELVDFGDGTRCVAVEGDAAATWLAELNASNQQTTWTTDGENRYMIQARPLLPHEDVACP
jgi:hypothetical protein